MGIALKADHVIATMCLLSRSGTCWARRCVKLEVFHGSFVLFGELSCVSRWSTTLEFAMPALFASTAEGVRAVFADRQ
jgi:hypothetical protein